MTALKLPAVASRCPIPECTFEVVSGIVERGRRRQTYRTHSVQVHPILSVREQSTLADRMLAEEYPFDANGTEMNRNGTRATTPSTNGTESNRTVAVMGAA